MRTHDPEEKLKVLLIEDDPLFQELAEATLAAHCELFIARTIAEGSALLEQHDDIAVLILDGHVPISRADPRMGSTLPLAERVMDIRKDRITLFAASGDPLMNCAFVHIGARNTDKCTAYPAAARFLHQRA